MDIADDTIVVPDRLAAPLDTGQRAFRIALALALLSHAALFIQIGRSVPRTMGDRSGASDAIAVELVTDADLKSLEAVAVPPAGAPPPPPVATPQPEPTPAPTPEPQPQPKTEAAPPAPVEPQPKPPPAKEETTAALPDFESVLKDLATTPMPDPSKPAEKAPDDPSKPETKASPEAAEPVKPAEKPPPKPPAAKKAPAPQARLDPSLQDFDKVPPGQSAGASRPPGITRSGENDDFGRGVIRALRQTMPPPPRGAIATQVTVRFTLNENGDIAEMRVIAPSGTSLDQNVLFAIKQTYFPLPPYKSTAVDRTFRITYVYR